MSIAAQVGVLPVLLWVFGRFPLVTPVSNLAAAPVAEVLGVYGMLASVAAGSVPRLGPLLQQPTAWLVAWITPSLASVRRAVRARSRATLGLGVPAAANRVGSLPPCPPMPYPDPPAG